MAEVCQVLIADDQPHILLTLEYLVRRLGQVRTLTACHGQDAVRKACDLRPDLVLLDVMMPQLDGYTACRMIRDHWGQQHHGEIWFITARGSYTDHQTAKTVGANRIVCKPFHPDQLLAEVRGVLERTGRWPGAAVTANASGSGFGQE